MTEIALPDCQPEINRLGTHRANVDECLALLASVENYFRLAPSLSQNAKIRPLANLSNFPLRFYRRIVYLSFVEVKG
jgi:hypothetical protein